MGKYAFYLLLDWGSRESQDFRSAAVWVLWLKLVVEKVAHDQVVEVILIGVMALVEHYQIDLLHFCKSMHKQIIKFLSHCNEDIVFIKLLSPSLEFRVVLTTFLLAPEITSHDKVCVTLDRRSLLLNQVLDGDDEKYLLSITLDRYVGLAIQKLLMTLI